MKHSKMEIYEPAMCCETGLCGTSIDPELLRVSSAVRQLQEAGFSVQRYNLNSSPMKFVTNVTIASLLQKNGPDQLPIVLLDGEVKMVGRYPTNADFCSLMQADPAILNGMPSSRETDSQENRTCCCSNDNTCC
ncbi:MAG: arsenite efflux transporter metallochaperone ArsD [Acutalibacteraceae bacterium]